MKICIGTCGYGVSQKAYEELFSYVEIQQTFYQPPGLSTLEKWRRNAPEGFEFTIKAWQLITHESKSPTYKRLKKNLSDTELQEAGYFKSTSVVKEAWDVTFECAKTLRAKAILFQCPASFKQTEINIKNMKNFFCGIQRDNISLYWEPRGNWEPDAIKRICNELDLRHAVDPFTAIAVTPEKCYFRLHGRKGWRYKYEDSELEELALMLNGSNESYVFFNNISMTEDALRFKKIISADDKRTFTNS